MLASEELLTGINKLRADALLIDIELHFAVLVCLQLGMPIILAICWYSIFRDPRLPPMHTTLIPPVTDREALLIQEAWNREIRAKRKKRIRQAIRHSLRNFISPVPVPMDTLDTAKLSMTARHHGLSLDSLADYGHWLRPMVLRHLPILAYNIHEMDFPHERHKNLHYVGPMIYEQRVDPAPDQKSGKTWTALRQKYRRRQDGQPLVYCSLGTFWNADTAFLERVIGIFYQRPQWHLLIGLGGKLTADDFEADSR